MRNTLLIFLLQLLMLQVFAQFSVSENKHFILRDGKPFFWLGDTGWELFHRLNREQADYYLKRRAEQGFTVIQAVALAEFDGLHKPNPNGDLPLLNDDPATPNDAYFKHVDYVIDKAATYNLVIGLLPTWGDKIWKGHWGIGPEVFTPANAKIYGKWLGERYKNKTNIIWILGGDRNPQNDIHVAIWRSMAAGIIEGVGTAAKPMISFHPQPNETSSAEWFHKDDWLSFNMFQNGHCRNNPVQNKIKAVYNIQPTKPVMDAEPLYEDHPICFNEKELGTSNAYDTRLYAYLNLFAGAHGHTYGCHGIWQFYSPYREAVNGPHFYWQQAMELPGANQMIYVKRLLLSRPFLDRVPDQSIIVENNNATAERIEATRGNDYIFIYSATGNSFTVTMGKISGAKLNAQWYNPRNGEIKKLNQLNNKGQQKFDPPSSGYGQDWILILDDASKNYESPK
jgi:hypothetical protein